MHASATRQRPSGRPEPSLLAQTFRALDGDAARNGHTSSSTPTTTSDDAVAAASSAPVVLKVTEIDCYEHNPRQFTNERSEEIRASIERNGFHGTLTVTKKPGAERHILSAGGNTMLTLLQQLYARTGDERYLWVHCRYQAYDSEVLLLSQHLGENLNRGDMRFWEVAKGMVDLLEMIESERRGQGINPAELSTREACEQLAARGLKAEKSTIALWRFTVNTLRRLGPAVAMLNYRGVQSVIQPRINALASLAEKFKVAEGEFLDTIVGPVLENYSRSLATGQQLPAAAMDPDALCDEVESAFAASMNEPVDAIRQMLATLRLNPRLELASLRQPSPNIIAGPGSTPGTIPVGIDAQASRRSSAPMLTRAQAPLALGPGLVRDRTQPLTIGHDSSGAASQVAPPAGQPGHEQQGTPAQVRRTSIGPLFESPGGADNDPLVAVHVAVERLAHAAGLANTLRWHDQMPLGFYLEPPDPRAGDQASSLSIEEATHRRSIRSTVWWSLTTMAGQWLPGSVDLIDHQSTFYRSFSTDQASSPLYGTGIEPSPPMPEEASFARITPGRTRVIMKQLMELECLVAEMLEQLPERWSLLRQLLEPQES